MRPSTNTFTARMRVVSDTPRRETSGSEMSSLSIMPRGPVLGAWGQQSAKE